MKGKDQNLALGMRIKGKDMSVGSLNDQMTSQA